MSKIVYAIVNNEPNTHLSGTNPYLTIVNKPEKRDESAVYSENNLEEAKNALEALREEFGDHLGLKKLEVVDMGADL